MVIDIDRRSAQEKRITTIEPLLGSLIMLCEKCEIVEFTYAECMEVCSLSRSIWLRAYSDYRANSYFNRSEFTPIEQAFRKALVGIQALDRSTLRNDDEVSHVDGMIENLEGRVENVRILASELPRAAVLELLGARAKKAIDRLQYRESQALQNSI